MTGFNLNIGASDPTGQYKREPWINFDIVKYSRVHLIGDAVSLPIKDNSINLIHCIHVLEHVTRDKYQPMLNEMYRVLKPGARAYVEVPDFRGVVMNLHNAIQEKDMRATHIWTTSIYGKNERSGMAHHWGFTQQLLQESMEKAGFNLEGRGREINMISGHYRQEPVLLMRGVK